MTRQVRFLTGARALETCIYGYNTYPDHLIGPASVLWHADDVCINAEHQGKGKAKATGPTSNTPSTRERVVWLRVHPSITVEVHKALCSAVSFALDSAKEAGRSTKVEMAVLREQFNVFEIIGPKASQVLKGALKPVDKKCEDFNKARTISRRHTSTAAHALFAVLDIAEQDTICWIYT